MPALSRMPLWGWYGLAVLVVALDQLTKGLAEAYLQLGRPVPVLPFLNLMLAYNPGAAFSLLSEAGGWQRWFFTAVAVGVSVFLVIWLSRLGRAQWLLALSLALILGGAVGNLWDRVVSGAVVDFISVHWQQRWFFPAFNVADAAITVGAALLILDMFLNPHSHGGKERHD